jgi:RNA polymerase sigma-70 factor (ECF subfamily)
MESSELRQRVTELIGQHYELLYRVSFRLTGSVADAEDLTQQTFLTAQQKLHQLRDTESAKGWLLTILRHHFFRNRRRAVRQSMALDALPEPSDSIDEPLEFDSEKLQLALNELPEEFRFPLVLFYFQELSYQEIAAQLDVPLGTVMSRLSRGKQHLRRRLSVEETTISPPSFQPISSLTR